MTGGFAQSTLRLNQGLGALSAWTKETIRERAQRLAVQAAAVWQAPKLDPATLA